jgi:SAM-dependent methyltransferase
MDISGFSNPWEHIRLLSDRPRNEVLIALLKRRAPEARVLEIGCGTGLLSVLAAKLGAREVIGVEPTPLIEVARALVADNQLDQVQLIEGRIEDLIPQPVDLAFSELLNADPFYEGLVEAMAAAKHWVVDGGVLAPQRLRVWVALTTGSGGSAEVRQVDGQLLQWEQTFGLKLGALKSALRCEESYRYFASTVRLASSPALAWDVVLGTEEEVVPCKEVALTCPDPGPVGGAVVWFEAVYDEGLSLCNAPGQGGHWGQLCFDWSTESAVVAGQKVTVSLELDEGEVDVVLA